MKSAYENVVNVLLRGLYWGGILLVASAPAWIYFLVFPIGSCTNSDICEDFGGIGFASFFIFFWGAIGLIKLYRDRSRYFMFRLGILVHRDALSEDKMNVKEEMRQDTEMNFLLEHCPELRIYVKEVTKGKRLMEDVVETAKQEVRRAEEMADSRRKAFFDKYSDK